MRDTDNKLSQTIWINVIATVDHEPDVPQNTLVHFYGLTHVNDTVADSGNIGLRDSDNTCQLTIPTLEHPQPITFKFAIIPTRDDNDPMEAELAKYCSPSRHTQWTKLEGYEDQNIYVLTLRTITLTQEREIRPIAPQIITFTFPSITTVTDLMELEEKAAERHHCLMLPCSEFSICPATLEIPIPSSPPHSHCMSDKCVRFYEMTRMTRPTPPA